MECLNCGLEMQTLQRDHTAFNHCYQCGSHWFARDDLKALMGESVLREEELVQRLKWPQVCKWCDALGSPGQEECAACGRDLVYHCPQDGETMLFVAETKGVELDFCSQCHGLWFDGQELEKVLTLHGFNRRVRRPLLQKPPAGCQICGAQEEGLAFTRGFFRCASCDTKAKAQPEPNNAKLREEYLAYWRARARRERNQEVMHERDHHEAGDAIKQSVFLNKLCAWLGLDA